VLTRLAERAADFELEELVGSRVSRYRLTVGGHCGLALFQL
jgi:hypothetical protein